MRDLFLEVLNEVRAAYDFALIGYVVMPEHIHLLISEPNTGNPSLVMKAQKERVAQRSTTLRAEGPRDGGARFWEKRFYDFNVWSVKKKNEKLNYMHFNPVKRGLVQKPADWLWSSSGFYAKAGKTLCAPNPDWRYKGQNTHASEKRSMRHPAGAVAS